MECVMGYRYKNNIKKYESLLKDKSFSRLLEYGKKRFIMAKS
jgi:hypothetical protein